MILRRVRRAWLPVALSLCAATIASRRSDAADPTSSPRIGRTIPNLSLATLDRNVIRLVDRKGRLTVLAYVRARQALSRNLLRDLQAEYDKLRAKSIEVIAVVPGESPPGYWREMVGKQGIRFPLAFDAEGRLLASMGWKALPITVVLDAENKVASAIFLHRASFARTLWREVRRAGLPDAETVRQEVAAAEARQAAARTVRELVRTGNATEALSAIAQARRRYPDRFAVRMLLGKALIELGYPSEATKEFLAAEKLERTSLRARFWLGIAHARSGDDRQAEALLSEVVASMPDAWRAHGELGLIKRRRGNLKEASRLLRKSVGGETDLIWATGGGWVGSHAPILEVVDVEGNPGRPTTTQPTVGGARLPPTVVLFWRTDDEASSACLRQLQAYHALSGDRDLAVVAVNVDRRRFSDADRARVREAARAAGLSLRGRAPAQPGGRAPTQPGGPAPARPGGRAPTQPGGPAPTQPGGPAPARPEGRGSVAVWLDADLESFSRYDGSAIPLTVLIDRWGVVRRRIVGADLSTLADSLTALGASPPAVGSQPTTKADRPGQSPQERYLAMARHLARQGRLAAAIESVRRSLAEAPAPAGAAALLSRLLSASGRVDEAAELLAEATRHGPVSPGLSTAYGDCLVRLGLTAQAEEWYRGALGGRAGYAPAHRGLGRVLAARAANEQALEEVRLAAKLNPHDERALVLLGEVLESMGRLPEAVEAFEAAFRLRTERNAETSRRWRSKNVEQSARRELEKPTR